MQRSYSDIHPHFKLQGFHYSKNELKDVSYSLIKEGDKEERLIGDFLMDWISAHDHVPVRTSGSTGTPKTINLSKQAMVNSALATASYFGIKEKDTALLCLSAEHIAAKMMLVRAMVLGLSLDMVTPSSSPLTGLDKTYDLCSMVPMQLEKSLRHLSRIGTLLVGGAPVSKELRQKVQKCKARIYETYGMTETCSHIALRPLNGEGAREMGGSLAPFHTLPGITVTADVRGCLQIHAPDLGIASLKTNDLVELVSEFEFVWLGRWDNVINSGGVKLFPEQIEEKLSAVLSGRYIITSKPDDSLGEKLVLVLEAEKVESGLLEKIQALGVLNAFEKPKEIVVFNPFPLTKTGKLDRLGIREKIIS